MAKKLISWIKAQSLERNCSILGAVSGAITAALLVILPLPVIAGPSSGYFYYPGIAFGVTFAIFLTRSQRLHRGPAIVFAIGASVANYAATFVAIRLMNSLGTTFVPSAIGGAIGGAVGGSMLALIFAFLLRLTTNSASQVAQTVLPPTCKAALLGAALLAFIPPFKGAFSVFCFYIVWQSGYAAALAQMIMHPRPISRGPSPAYRPAVGFATEAFTVTQRILRWTFKKIRPQVMVALIIIYSSVWPDFVFLGHETSPSTLSELTDWLFNPKYESVPASLLGVTPILYDNWRSEAAKTAIKGLPKLGWDKLLNSQAYSADQEAYSKAVNDESSVAMLMAGLIGLLTIAPLITSCLLLLAEWKRTKKRSRTTFCQILCGATSLIIASLVILTTGGAAFGAYIMWICGLILIMMSITGTKTAAA